MQGHKVAHDYLWSPPPMESNAPKLRYPKRSEGSHIARNKTLIYAAKVLGYRRPLEALKSGVEIITREPGEGGCSLQGEVVPYAGMAGSSLNLASSLSN